MSLSEQLPEPYTNNEENNQEVNLQVNQQINQQVNQYTYQQEISNNIQTPNTPNAPNNRLSRLLCCAIVFLSLESIFFGGILIALLGAMGLRRYPGDNEEKESKGLKLMFGFGMPCSFLPCIIISVSQSQLKPKIVYITNIILILIKTGLFAGFFIGLSLIGNPTVFLIGIFPEVVFDFLVVINDSSKLNNENNRNQDNN